MSGMFTAQMSNLLGGGWRLYVVLYDTTAPWPAHRFEGAEAPTFTERAEAFSLLGFEPVAGAEWRWTEYSKTPDDPASAVVLVAAIQVRSCAGVAA
ncbi:DUF6303 family protein [Streptomyces sp. AA1529]|uniref:DUF6303 family protein n=1 Tax=Streptomyces sp. AA1529 TaxID=1203257 RepID=UPI003D728885